MAGSAHVQVECPACAADIVMDDVSIEGGAGGYVLKCQNCGHVFHFHLDQGASAVKVRGADVLARYEDTAANKSELLRRHGLSPED